MRALFLSLRISFMMLCAPVITMACEIRRPWWVRKDRVERAAQGVALRPAGVVVSSHM